MATDYATWAAQQHAWLTSAGGYGPPPAPPPDQQQAPPPDQAPADPGLVYDPATDSFVQQTAPDPTAPPPPPAPPPTSTWGGMAAAPPIQSPPAAQPPSGPTLGPTGLNQSGPVQGTELAGPTDQPAPPPEQTPPAPVWTGNPTTLGDAATQHQQAATRYNAPSGLAGGEDQMGKKPKPEETPPVSLAPATEQLVGGLGPIGAALNIFGQQGTSGLAPLNPVADWLVHNSLPAQTPGGENDPAAGLHRTMQAHAAEAGAHSIVQSEQQRQATVDQQARQAEADTRKVLLAQHNKSLGFMMSASMAPGGPGLAGFLHPEDAPGALGAAKDKAGDLLTGALALADKPRQGNIEHITQQTLDAIQGKPQSELALPGWDQLQGGVLRPYTDWIKAHPDQAIGDATNGYGLDPATGQPFTGPRAVWEDFIHDKPAWQRVLYDTAADPTSYLPSAEKAVEGVGLGARLTQQGLDAAAESALRRGKAGLARALGEGGAGRIGLADVPAAVADYAEGITPFVHHPLQSAGSRLPDWMYSSSVRAQRAEQALTELGERALQAPPLEPEPSLGALHGPAAPVGPPAPPPTNAAPPGLVQTPPTNGHIPTNGHAPTPPLPPVTIPTNGAVPVAADAAAPPVEPGVIPLPAPAARVPSEGAQRLERAASDLARLAQTGEVPTPSETVVQQTRRGEANAPAPVAGGTDFGHGVVAHDTPNAAGRFDVSVDGVVQPQASQATPERARRAAAAIAQHRDAHATLAALKDVPGAAWNSDEQRAARSRLYRSGQLNKTYRPGTPGYDNFVDLQAARLDHADPEIADATRAGLQHDLELRPRADSRRAPLDPRVYNDILDKAGAPGEKINPHTFYVGPDGQRTPLIAGHNARNIETGDIGRMEKATSDGLGVVLRQPDGATTTVPLDKLDIPNPVADHPSPQALGIVPPKPGEKLVNAVQKALPSPLTDHPVVPDATSPVPRKQWADHLLPPEDVATLNKTINKGTFARPKPVTWGDQLFDDWNQFQGWRDLANGRADVDPPSAAKPWGGADFQRLFDAGVIDATGTLDEGRLNKQLIRLGLADDQGNLTDLGHSFGAADLDGLKRNLAGADDPIVQHLIAQANAADYGIDQGWRAAGSRAMIDQRLGVTKAYDHYLSFLRGSILGNPASAPPNFFANLIGDGIAAAIGGPVTFLNYVAPLDWKALWAGAKDVRISLSFEDKLAAAGLPRTDILRETGPLSKSALAKATWLGPLRAPTQALMAPEFWRRAINMPDGKVRVAAAETRWNALYPRMLAQLPDEAMQAFRGINLQLAAGHAPFPNWEAELGQALREMRNPDPNLGRVFSAYDLRDRLMQFFDDKLAANPTLTTPGRQVWKDRIAEPLSKQWDAGLRGVRDEAIQEVRRVGVDFTPTRLDEWAQRVFLFHFWNSRAGAQYVVEALKNPKYLAGFTRGMAGLEKQAEADNAPPFLKYFYKYSQSPDGIAMWFSPLRLISVWSTGLAMYLNDPDDPTAKKDLTGLGHIVEGPIGSLAYMAPPLKAALALAGALGPDAKTPDIFGGDAAMLERFETWLNQANLVQPFFTDDAGNPKQILLSDSRTALNLAMNWVHQWDSRFGLNAQDANASDKITLRNFVFDQVKQNNPAADPTTLEAKTAAALADPGSKEYQAALKQTATAQTAGPGTGHGGIGDVAGWLLRMGLGNGTLTATDPNADAAAKRSYGTKEDQARADIIFSSGDEENKLNLAEDQYKQAGGKDRVYYDVYNGIKYGTVAAYDDDGTFYRPAQLQAMTADQRQHLADVWLSQQPRGPAAIQKVYDAQDKILKANPDLAGAKAMRQLAEASPAGVDEWIAATRARNPGFDAYLREQERKGNPASSAAFWLDGYRALVGLPSGFNNQNPTNPHPDVPGLENGETLAEHFFAQQAEDRGTGDGGKQGTLDDLRAVAAVKATIDAYDPSGQLWQVYLQNAGLPKEQRTKLPYDLYTQIKGAIPGKDDARYDYPGGYALMFLQQDQPFDDWWINSGPQRRLAAAAKTAAAAAFDPNALNGSAAAPPATTDQAPATGHAVTTADLNLRDGPNGQVIGVGPAGATVTILAVQGDWAQVRLWNGATGWMARQYLQQ